MQECKTMVSWGRAKTLEITGYGNVYIEFIDSKEKMLLQNCLYMLQIGINLISQGKLQNIQLVFLFAGCALIRNNKVITKGDKIGNLYYLPIRVIKHYNITKSKPTINIV